MVHYSRDPISAAQSPPPLCPKCGNHKTEVVGRSSDLKILFLRCDACGARSEVPAAEAAAFSAW
jgi:transcription elongation factor Elf1